MTDATPASRDPQPPSTMSVPADAARLVAFLASNEAAGITGQAVGIGGDRLSLWSHPAEIVTEFAEGGGWSADAIAAAWADRFAKSQQPTGQQFPRREE